MKKEKKKKEKKKKEKKKKKIKKKKKEKKEEKKKEETKKEETKKDRLPIIPYKIDPSYQNKLIAGLKNHQTRPSQILAPEIYDIRENISKLEKKEEVQEKLDEADELKAEFKEKEIRTILNSYRDSTIAGQTLLQDPYALFSGAEKAYIDQFYKLSDLFVICPLYFNYRISLEYCISGDSIEKKYEAYHLFNTKEISPKCSHNCCSNQLREIDINIFNFIVDPKDRKMQKFVSMKKPCRCAISCLCACCSRPTFIVETPIESIGKIIELRTVCDPIIQILDINDDVIYNITTSCSNCGFCLRDQCCDNRKCASCEFIIQDEKKNNLGKIIKDHRSGKKTKPDYDQLVVVFPPNSSCQQKILITCATLALEYLYFQKMTNLKRCSGNPKFINTPY